MKLAVIGHSYVTSFAQRKYVAIKRVRPSIKIRLIVPDRVQDIFTSGPTQRHPNLSEDELVICRSVYARSPMAQGWDPLAIACALREFQPDIIHVEEDPYSVIGLETMLIARTVCRGAKLTWFTWDNLARRPRFPKSVIKKTLMRVGLKRASLVVCGNRDAQTLLHGRKGFDGLSVVLPQLGVDTPSFDLAAEPTVDVERVVTVGYIGRLVEEKGILDLISALGAIRGEKWRFVAIGKGPLEGTVREWALSLPEHDIRVEAPLPHDQVSRALSKIDVFVLPSVSTATWKEQFGLTLAMAMMAGCACIGSDSGAIPEVIGDAGLIFREGDAEGMKDALNSLLSDHSKLSSYRCMARSRALEVFSHEKVGDQYVAAFDRVLANV